MFVVIYQNYIKPEMEQAYQTLWRQVASYFIAHKGALGSCLHKTEEGIWLAYSRWPDRKTRDAAWVEDISTSALPDEIKKIIMQMKACKEPGREISDIYMEVIDDLL